MNGKDQSKGDNYSLVAVKEPKKFTGIPSQKAGGKPETVSKSVIVSLQIN